MSESCSLAWNYILPTRLSGEDREMDWWHGVTDMLYNKVELESWQRGGACVKLSPWLSYFLLQRKEIHNWSGHETGSDLMQLVQSNHINPVRWCLVSTLCYLLAIVGQIRKS